MTEFHSNTKPGGRIPPKETNAMTEQEQQAQLQAMQAMIAELKAKVQPAQPSTTGYGDAQTPQQAASSELVTVALPFSCRIDGKWLNWTETYQIADGADAFNALIDRIKAKGKPLNLKGDSSAQGGGYGKR